MTGSLALAWFLVRVIPKPRRITYPCQRVAAPLAWSLLCYVASLFVSVSAFRRAGRHFREYSYVLSLVCLLLGLGAVVWHMNTSALRASAAFSPTETNEPIGVARGINAGRVVWARDPDATSWDGANGNWWATSNTDQVVIDAMFAGALRQLTSQNTATGAWDALFKYYNQQMGKGDVGYTNSEEIVIKINLNNVWQNDDKSGREIDALPQMVLCVLRQLIYNAGVPESAITIYDAQRKIAHYLYNYCYPEFTNVQYVGSAAMPGRQQVTWAATAITYSAEIFDLDARRLPQRVLDAEYMINMPILKRHDGVTAVTLSGKNHFGTCGSPSELHWPSMSHLRGMGTYDPQVDLMGSKDVGAKTILYVMDGIYCGLDYDAVPARWQMPPFSNDWPSSIFLSQDPVAIDSVGIDFLRAESTLRDYADNYLHEAALASNAPSGTFYDPENDGTNMPSLGVHEHWNDSTNKQYTRNLGAGDGVELVTVETDMSPALQGTSLAGAMMTFDLVHLLPGVTYDTLTSPVLPQDTWTTQDTFVAFSSARGWTHVVSNGSDRAFFRWQGHP